MLSFDWCRKEVQVHDTSGSKDLFMHAHCLYSIVCISKRMEQLMHDNVLFAKTKKQLFSVKNYWEIKLKITSQLIQDIIV